MTKASQPTTPYQKIAAGLADALAHARGEAGRGVWHIPDTVIPATGRKRLIGKGKSGG